MDVAIVVTASGGWEVGIEVVGTMTGDRGRVNSGQASWPGNNPGANTCLIGTDGVPATDAIELADGTVFRAVVVSVKAVMLLCVLKALLFCITNCFDVSIDLSLFTVTIEDIFVAGVEAGNALGSEKAPDELAADDDA